MCALHRAAAGPPHRVPPNRFWRGCRVPSVPLRVRMCACMCVAVSGGGMFLDTSDLKCMAVCEVGILNVYTHV